MTFRARVCSFFYFSNKTAIMEEQRGARCAPLLLVGKINKFSNVLACLIDDRKSNGLEAGDVLICQTWDMRKEE